MTETIGYIVGTTIAGLLIRVVIIVIATEFIRTGIKNKKRKEEFSLELKSERTRIFLGYLTLGMVIYMWLNGVEDSHRRLLWIGVFSVEIMVALEHFKEMILRHTVYQVSKPKKGK